MLYRLIEAGRDRKSSIKRVRIVSPHTTTSTDDALDPTLRRDSPASLQRRPNVFDENNSSPQAQSFRSHLAPATGGGEVAHDITQILPLYNSTRPTPNPFDRTLATIEPEHDQLASKSEIEDDTFQSDSSSHHSQPFMDVDSFKRLLMTGKSSSSTNAAPTHGAFSSSHISHSSGDGFIDTPSYHGDNDSSDGRTPVQSSKARKQKLLPHAPAPQIHEKRTSTMGPQTVSFSDFEMTEEGSDHAPGHRAPEEALHGLLPSVSPLSSPPTAEGARNDSCTNPSIISHGVRDREAAAPQRRVPPPVPLSRRMSGLKISKQEHFSTTYTQPPSPGLRSPSLHSLETKPRAPPAPPARRTSARSRKASDQSSEAASLVSEDSAQAEESPSRILSMPNRTSMPPPPPPPRRRGSSKSSLDMSGSGASKSRESRNSNDFRRTSQDSVRRSFGLSQVHEAGADATKPPSDILEDLARLQAEVDALRRV